MGVACEIFHKRVCFRAVYVTGRRRERDATDTREAEPGGGGQPIPGRRHDVGVIDGAFPLAGEPGGWPLGYGTDFHAAWCRDRRGSGLLLHVPPSRDGARAGAEARRGAAGRGARSGAVMRAWGAYALTALGLTALAAALTAWLVEAPSTLAVWVGAGVALIVQLAAFAALVALRDRGPLFLAGWLGGMLLRFGAVGVMGVWLSRTDALPRSA